MATTIEQPSHEIPQKKEVKQAGTHHIEKYQRRKNGERSLGGETSWKKTLWQENATQRKLYMPLNHMKDVVNYWANA